ncbi:MAG: xanthine dehydrogenase family protein molybdopterin-binding subunit [Nocardiopsaceae bacterium]|nr:xanthine dehydrogenase family protein molybdopterin-binding subunit [Nocardiopsaceae bacterium]
MTREAATTAARSRVDGPAKVTGTARYTADIHPDGLVYAALVPATVPSGRITAIDTEAARSASGVLAVITHENAPRVETVEGLAQTWLPVQDDLIRHEGQPVAIVVAETTEQAQYAAELVRVTCERSPARLDFRAHRDEGHPVPTFTEPDSTVGDVDAALKDDAEVIVDQRYRTADRHHNPMEPSATIAEWRDGDLLLYDATQHVWGPRAVAAAAFGLEPERVRVRCDFLGGGFGAKGYSWPHELLAPLAAKVVGRPVRLLLTRAQMYTSHGRQTGTEQRVTLGAKKDGTLVAIRHASATPTSVADDYIEVCAAGTRSAYACPAIETRSRAVPVNLPIPTPMRAPHEGPGMAALEIAMDELAVELDTDPLELRLRNYAEADPTKGVPFSSKRLRDCYLRGAERFGWAGRPAKPRQMRDGNDLVGWGMATAIMSTFRFPATARVSVDRDGNVLIEAGSQEIGGGTYTTMPQIAAGVLGIDPARVRLALGDTALPQTGGTFGSSTTLSVGSAVADAARKLEVKLRGLADGADPARAGLGRLLSHHCLDRLEAEGSWAPGGNAVGEGPDLSIATFGAVFAEVRVDADLGLPRLSRLTGVYSAGRIINPKTARSQITGGMIWGLGQALLEESDVDVNLGRFVSKNLAGYLVPVNADVPHLDASFIEDEVDQRASPVGAKGIGELGAVGVAPAIANAVHHATGIRVRTLPIRPETLLVD